MSAMLEKLFLPEAIPILSKDSQMDPLVHHRSDKYASTLRFAVQFHFLLLHDSATLRHTDRVLSWFKSQSMIMRLRNICLSPSHVVVAGINIRASGSGK